MNSNREFDIIIYGASGYTGQLVLAHLINNYGLLGEVRFAIAGRDIEKMKQVRAALNAPSLQVIVADANDEKALKNLVLRTSVLITTVGPYRLYGDNVIAACAQNGTDYLDLCGEPSWIAEKISQHHETAKQTGSRIIFSCGFDSVPFDLGVYFLQEYAAKKTGVPCSRVSGRIRKMRGGISGGTLASGVVESTAAIKDEVLKELSHNAFALTPGFQGPVQPDSSRPYEDKRIGSWVIPFMMASINSKAVHRTNFLLGHPYGRDFAYDEMLMISGVPKEGMSRLGFDLPTQPLNPGEGPTKAERESGSFDLLFVGEAKDGQLLKVSVKGDMDPGYGSTSKMLVESALCLRFELDHETLHGGCTTVASSMGDKIISRLQEKAGLKFMIEEL